MKTIRTITLTVLLLGCTAAAWAQDHSRSWEPGAVLSLTEVHVNDGMWNAYINDLKTNWRRSLVYPAAHSVTFSESESA